MIIASYNVENMFERPKVFAKDKQWRQKAVPQESEPDDPQADRKPVAPTRGTVAVGDEVIKFHDELNRLFKKERYRAADKRRMAEVIERLGLRKSDTRDLVVLRVIRGDLLKRPKDENKPVEIVAKGRADWVGWLDLRTEPVDELATTHIAKTIAECNPDILGVVEAENRPLLATFAKAYLKSAGGQPYDQVMLFDGNDDRGIDVGLLVRSRKRYPVTDYRTHIYDTDSEGRTIFSRDCAEYHIEEVSTGRSIVVLLNHFKSKGYNDEDDPIGAKQRRRQAQRVRAIYDDLLARGFDQVVVMGDLNDSPTLAGGKASSLTPLLNSDLRDISEHPAFTQDVRPGTFGTGGTLASKIDYILLSPALYQRVIGGGVNRKGIWRGPGVRNPWAMFSTLKEEQQAASDHALIWAELSDER